MSIWEDYEQFRLPTERVGAVSYRELQYCLDALHGAADVEQIEVGKSWEQRKITAIEIGSGDQQVLLWSQMHGDEPTHTVVLLELIRFLISGAPAADELKARLRLRIVPMLNPDGAERGTRQNAQGIDVNRDAQRRASPEAELLWRLISEQQVDFAFTLHNQRRSRTVDGQRLCALSLLVPPANAANEETPCMRRAKQVGSLIREASEPHANGMISRYVAGFMPRCFGEAIQMRGTSALLIEAGACPQLEGTWLTRLHLHALIAGLQGLSREELPAIDTAPYESLPTSADVDLLDILIRDVAVQDDTGQISSPLDIGVLHEPEDGLAVGGKFDEIGDLEGRFGRTLIDGDGLVAMPGMVRFKRDLRPGASDFEDQLADAAREGVEWLIGCYALNDSAEVAVLDKLKDARLPIDVGWVAVLQSNEVGMEMLHTARQQGAVAVAAGSDVFSLTPRLSEELVAKLRPALPKSRQLNWPLPSRFSVGRTANFRLVRQDHMDRTVGLVLRGELVLHDERLQAVYPGRMIGSEASGKR